MRKDLEEIRRLRLQREAEIGVTNKRIATLGAVVNGVRYIAAPGKKNEVWVTQEGRGSFTVKRGNANVADEFNRRVWIGKEPGNSYDSLLGIVEHDKNTESGDTENSGTITHAKQHAQKQRWRQDAQSGDAVDPVLIGQHQITDLLVIPDNGFTVRILPGFATVSGTLVEIPTGTFFTLDDNEIPAGAGDAVICRLELDDTGMFHDSYGSDYAEPVPNADALDSAPASTSGRNTLAYIWLPAGATELKRNWILPTSLAERTGGIAVGGSLPDFGAAAAVQISGGVLDISATSSRNIIVQAESGSADTVDAVVGLGDGQAAVFQADSGDVITFAHSADIGLYGATDLDISSTDLLMLVGRGSGVVAQPVDEKGTGGGGGAGAQPQSDLIFLHRFAKVSGSFSIPLTYTAGSSWMFGVTVNQNTPGNGDSMEVDVVLAAGTYTLSVVGFAFNNRGRLDWSIDGGSPFISAQEWYSAGGNNNLIQTGSFTVADAGRHVLSFTVNGKHASSSNYYFAISAVWITKSSYTVDT